MEDRSSVRSAETRECGRRSTARPPGGPGSKPYMQQKLGTNTAPTIRANQSAPSSASAATHTAAKARPRTMPARTLRCCGPGSVSTNPIVRPLAPWFRCVLCPLEGGRTRTETRNQLSRRGRSRRGVWSDGLLALAGVAVDGRPGDPLGERRGDEHQVDAHAVVLVEVAAAGSPSSCRAGPCPGTAWRNASTRPQSSSLRTAARSGSVTCVAPSNAFGAPDVAVLGRDVEVAERRPAGPSGSRSWRSSRAAPRATRACGRRTRCRPRARSARTRDTTFTPPQFAATSRASPS